MRRLVFFLALWAGLTAVATAQAVKKVSGTYIYVVPETQSMREAREEAVTRAKLQLLADNFGTVLDLSSSTSIGDDGAKTVALSQSQVKGEWLETIGEPVITRLFEGEQMAIKVEIKGRAREIVTSTSDFTAKVLCKVADPSFERSSFENGDSVFLLFQAPGDGYLAVYLFDGMDTVSCLLPYKTQSEGVFPVKGGKEYIFFSPDFEDGVTPYNSWIEQYTLQTPFDLEIDRFYVVYSPNRFMKARDSHLDDAPRQLSFGSFQKWLSRVRTEDTLLCVKTIDVEIHNR